MANYKREIVKRPHHEQKELCLTRAKYRQGRKLTAVKVYTVNDESTHLLIVGVPALGLQDDLKRVGSRFGDMKSLVPVPGFSEEEFTDAYHVQYSRVQSARHAKRRLDGMSFYGGVLHVCYAPEMETIAETRAKLVQRRKDVACRTNGRVPHSVSLSGSQSFKGLRKGGRETPKFNSKRPCLDEQSLASHSCIWKGQPVVSDPRISTKSETAPEYGPFLPEGMKPEAVVTSRTTDFSNKQNASFNWSSLNKFIPRQIAVKKEIVFRKTSDNEADHMSDEYTRIRSEMAEDNTLIATHKQVQKMLDKVAAPNVEVKLSKVESVLNM